MRGFTEKTTWRLVETGMMVTAAAGLYVGYNESDPAIVTLAACLGLMTAVHYQHSHF